MNDLDIGVSRLPLYYKRCDARSEGSLCHLLNWHMSSVDPSPVALHRDYNQPHMVQIFHDHLSNNLHHNIPEVHCSDFQ